jgi:hypothetical protein
MPSVICGNLRNLRTICTSFSLGRNLRTIRIRSPRRGATAQGIGGVAETLFPKPRRSRGRSAEARSHGKPEFPAQPEMRPNELLKRSPVSVNSLTQAGCGTGSGNKKSTGRESRKTVPSCACVLFGERRQAAVLARPWLLPHRLYFFLV